MVSSILSMLLQYVRLLALTRISYDSMQVPYILQYVVTYKYAACKYVFLTFCSLCLLIILVKTNH